MNQEAEKALKIQVLGNFSVRTCDERPKAVPRLVARVGTVLAGWPGQWVGRDRLVQELWGDRPPRTAANTLQAHVSQLRRLVGKDRLLSDANGYLLDVDPSDVDAERFQELLHEAARAQRHLHLARAEQLLGDALALWHGTPYLDVTDPELRARRARLEELRNGAFEDRLECQLEIASDQHELHDGIATARELVSLSPLRERRHMLLIRALTAAHRVAEAHAAVEEARAHIRLITGTEPSDDIAMLDPSLSARAENLFPMTQSLPRPMDVPVERPAAEVNEAIAARLRELLVDHNARIVFLQADAAHHDAIARCVAQTLRGDFPRGILTRGAHEPAAAQAPNQRGVLTILTAATASALTQLASEPATDNTTTLVLTDKKPPASHRDVSIDAMHVVPAPLQRTS